jgi:hypothetical protein
VTTAAKVENKIEVDPEENNDSDDSVSDGHFSSIDNAGDGYLDEDQDDQEDEDEESEDEIEANQTETGSKDGEDSEDDDSGIFVDKAGRMTTRFGGRRKGISETPEGGKS